MPYSSKLRYSAETLNDTEELLENIKAKNALYMYLYSGSNKEPKGQPYTKPGIAYMPPDFWTSILKPGDYFMLDNTSMCVGIKNKEI